MAGKNIAGLRFGSLVALREKGKDRYGQIRWLCQCDCGEKCISLGTSLRSGNTKTCGCSKFSHGLSYTKEYRAWQDMMYRCYNPNNISYKNYGGRGITVCHEWRNSVACFIKDLGKKPSPKHTIERINNNGNYCAANCRWATKKEQTRNTRKTKSISFRGKTLCMADWDTYLGFTKNTVGGRIRRGWPIEKALTTPIITK